MMKPLTGCYAHRLAGLLFCYDRIIATGTPLVACYAAGMTRSPQMVRKEVGAVLLAYNRIRAVIAQVAASAKLLRGN